jgi:hypothetical protein
MTVHGWSGVPGLAILLAGLVGVWPACGADGDGEEQGEGEGAAEGEGEGEGSSISGSLFFEARIGGVSGEGAVVLGEPKQVPAAAATAFAVDRDGVVLGSALIRGQGTFSIEVPRAVQAGDLVLVTAALVDAGHSYFAVLRPDAGGAPRSLTSPLWVWALPVDASGRTGAALVKEEQGSGALFIYLINLVGLSSMLEGVGDDARFQTLAVLWAPGVAWDCGACYSVLEQATPSGPTFARSIFLSSDTDDSGAWAAPVLLHEMGHYAASSYSRDDSPGGTHHRGELLPPPFAWSEGWATFFGQSTLSRWSGQRMPVYWDMQAGSSFWIDLAAAQYPEGGIQHPNPDGGMAQHLDGNYVASMLWHLWDGEEVQEDDPEQDLFSMTTTEVLATIMSSGFLDLDRGATGLDFVDYVDTLFCERGLPAVPSTDRLWRTVVMYLGFPLDWPPTCR